MLKIGWGDQTSSGRWWRMKNLTRYQGWWDIKRGDFGYTSLAGFLWKLDGGEDTEVQKSWSLVGERVQRILTRIWSRSNSSVSDCVLFLVSLGSLFFVLKALPLAVLGAFQRLGLGLGNWWLLLHGARELIFCRGKFKAALSWSSVWVCEWVCRAGEAPKKGFCSQHVNCCIALQLSFSVFPFCKLFSRGLGSW